MPDTGLAADIVILGAGPVGMALARALQDSPLRVLLVDARPRGAWATDPRALAIAHGSRQLLERLDAWNPAAGTAIKSIHVSQRGGFGRAFHDAYQSAWPCAWAYRSARRLASTLAGGSEWAAPPSSSSSPS